MQEEEGISVKWYILNLVLQDPGHSTRNVRGGTYFLVSWVNVYCIKAWSHDNPGHGTRNARGVPLPVSINVYIYILTSKSILQSSTELAHAGYIYIVFCVLLIVLCFIMFLLSWDRSLGRCF